MSKIAIKGATTGTGVFTLESPATNTDRTLVLPDEAGTVLTSASGVAKTGDTMTGGLYLDTGLSQQQLTVKGLEADIWLRSTGANAEWRILGSTGENTHRFRIYDQTGAKESFAIDSAGRVTMPYQPYFYAGSTHSGTYTAGALMPYDTVATNTGNHYNTSTYLFTAPIAGRYLFTVSALNYPNSSIGELYFTVNGSTYNPLFRDNSIVAQQSISGSAILNLSANDTVGVQGTLYFYAFVGHGHFSGILLG